MTLTQLAYVLAVAELRSFSRAARRCHVIQPTLSSGVAVLEEELGARIFRRSTRAVSMTPFGEALLPTVAQVLRGAEALRLVADGLLRPERVVLCVGVSPLVDARLIAMLLGSFEKSRPGCATALVEDNLQDLARRLADGSLDVMIVPVVAPAPRGSVHRVPLYSEPLCAVSSALPAAASIRLDEIPDRTFVLVPDTCGLTTRTRELFKAQRRELRPAPAAAMSYAVLENWAGLGLGAAILPRSKITASCERWAPIVDRRGRPVTIDYEAQVSHESGKAGVAAFLEHVKGVVGPLVRGLDLDAARG
jgi:DNA-binding transcriptional LysR family regulator